MVRSFQLTKALMMPFIAGILIGVAGTSLGATILGSSVFSDVQPGSYYDAAVGRLNAAGIVKGSNGLFKPADFVTRADVAVMLDRAINGGELTASSSSRRSTSSSSSSSSSSSTSSVAGAGSIHFTTTGFTVGGSVTRATATVVRTGGDTGIVKVDYAFGGGTAVSGTDYSPSSGTITFIQGETTKTITVSLIQRVDRGALTLGATLSNPTGGASISTPSSLTLTLLGNGKGANSAATGTGSTTSGGGSSSTSSVNGAGSFIFSANTYSVDENGGALTITVNRVNGSNGAVTVNYATGGGTATVGTHYSNTTGTLNFGAGETSKTFSVQVADNGTIDGNKTVNLTLTTPTGGANIITPSTAVMTIVDTEAGATSGTGSLQYSAPSYTILESAGAVTITIQRVGSNKGTVNVNYATSDSTATSVSDYTPKSGTMTFLPGEMTKSFDVLIIKDALVEPEEIINLALSSVTGPATLGAQSTSYIKIN